MSNPVSKLAKQLKVSEAELLAYLKTKAHPVNKGMVDVAAVLDAREYFSKPRPKTYGPSDFQTAPTEKIKMVTWTGQLPKRRPPPAPKAQEDPDDAEPFFW